MTIELWRDSVSRDVRANAPARPMKIAIASSGLGHVCRGVESWANDTASALKARGQDVTLFQGAGVASEKWRQVVPCMRRDMAASRRITSLLQRAGGWRFGCGSGYEIEQTTFALRLWTRIRFEFDIVHVQDPGVALILDHLNRLGLSRPRVILAHGTEENARTLARLGSLQHLAPCYGDEWEAHRTPGQRVFALPNFVDVDVFAPGDRERARLALGLPTDGLIVLSVAAVKIHHKRVDALLREFAEFQAGAGRRAKLIVVGGREAETDEVVALARDLGNDVLIRTGVDRSLMPQFYRAADVFALASLHEMMPIAVLEALASGLPIACNDTPVLRWMVGDAGCLTDIATPGMLAGQMEALAHVEVRRRRASTARTRAETLFSADAVMPQMLEMYTQVLDRSGAPPKAAIRLHSEAA
jgi:glycosyltransferase involved in cell wall biosynthesis